MRLYLQNGIAVELSIHQHYNLRVVDGDICAMKTELLQIRLLPEEKASFQKAADLAGIPLSSWVRERLRRLARTELIDANQRVPFLEAAGASK